MKLNSMRFKGFVWPHNPTVYTISYERNMALHKVPFGRYRLQSLGMTRRVMKGEGEFAGADAYRQFQALASVFYQDSPGTLVHPLWNSTSAWFVKLELAQEPREDYVRYRFEFWEDYTGYQTGVETIAPPKANTAADTGKDAAGNDDGAEADNDTWAAPLWDASGTEAPAAGWTAGRASYHVVSQGETLWNIAQRYGMSVNRLTALNPQIKNPNLIQIGQEVRVK